MNVSAWSRPALLVWTGAWPAALVCDCAWPAPLPCSCDWPALALGSAVCRLADQRHQLMQPGDVGALAHRRRQRPGAIAGHGQLGLAHEQPERREAAMDADDAGLVVGLDLAGRLDGDDPRLALDADQPRVVAEMIGKARLFARAFDRDRPRADLLHGAAHGQQPDPLQRIGDRLVVAVLGAMGDLQPHVSRTGSSRRPGRPAGCCRR